MQQHKSTNKFSEIKVFAKDLETLTSTLSEAMGKKHLAPFDGLKSKGLAISSIVSILMILPFYGVSSVYAFIKSGMFILIEKCTSISIQKYTNYFNVKIRKIKNINILTIKNVIFNNLSSIDLH